MNDEEVLNLISSGEKSFYEVIIRKYNQRLYRIARSIVKDDAEVQDILQDTYLKAYQALDRFERRSQFSTWLIRILINTANASVRKRKRLEPLPSFEAFETTDMETTSYTPDDYVSNEELRKILEKAIDHLPENLRCVYVMREVEGLSVAETAESLDLSEENVKTRLHRAKTMLKEDLYKRSKTEIDVFRFGSKHCDEVTRFVMEKILSGF